MEGRFRLKVGKRLGCNCCVLFLSFFGSNPIHVREINLFVCTCLYLFLCKSRCFRPWIVTFSSFCLDARQSIWSELIFLKKGLTAKFQLKNENKNDAWCMCNVIFFFLKKNKNKKSTCPMQCYWLPSLLGKYELLHSY